MVSLVTAHDYVVMFLIAAAFGALGGVAHLCIEADSPTRAPRLSAPRVFASLFVGAAAAIAISYLFTPEVIVTKADGTELRHWEIIRLVPLSLIVGAGGKAIFAALQDRVLGAAKDAQIQAGANVAAAATQQALNTVAVKAVNAVADGAYHGVREVVRTAGSTIPADLSEQLLSRFGPAEMEGLPVADADQHVADATQELADARAGALRDLQPEIENQVEYVQKAVAAVSKGTA